MRKLRFRAWDTVNNRMDTTFVISSQGHVSFTPLGMQQRDLDHYIIIQYTGLNDANGTEIYEGDIVIYKNYHMGTKYKTMFTNGAFKLCCDDYERHFDQCNEDIVVIGNIYEGVDGKPWQD